MRNMTRVLIYAGLAMMILVTSSCARAPATITLPPPFETSIPTLTASPENTRTPEVTSTSTATATVTPTSMQAGTPTQLPELGTPAPGTGNVTGLVLWNNQPVPQAAVWLCEEFQGTCKGPDRFRVNTDEQGYYLIHKVDPGKYIVAINSFNTGWFVFYVDKNGAREQMVTAGENLILDPFNIWKFNLQSIAPKPNKVLTDPKPAFTWEAYPGAAYYQIFIRDANSRSVVNGQRIDELTFTPADALQTCKYSWEVDAFNEQGIKIASTNPRNTNFSVINVPGKC